MNHISKDLFEDFQRIKRIIGPDPYSDNKCLGIYDVLKAHYLIIDFFAQKGEGVGGVGPRDINLLHSAMSRQVTGYGGVNKWESDFQICATLFFGIIKDHPFHDANKRTAFLSLLFHLWKLNRIPDTKRIEFEKLAKRIASNSLEKYARFDDYSDDFDAEVRFISDFIRRNTRKLNKIQYFVTYNELNSILRRFKYCLKNPEKNQIGVYISHEIDKGIFIPKKEVIERRIGVIGFPGWTTHVAMGTIRYVRQLTGLTPENGIDSETFFHGVDPLSSYIDQYQGILMRLSDK